MDKVGECSQAPAGGVHCHHQEGALRSMPELAEVEAAVKQRTSPGMII